MVRTHYRAVFYLLGMLAIASPAWPQNVPSVIPYQGQIADQSGAAGEGSRLLTLVFRIYSTPVGGVPGWQEVHDNVSVQEGYFSLLLGSRTAFPDLTIFKDTVYLGITIDDGDAQTADVELRPRQAIVPVLAAVQARDSDRAKNAEEAQHAKKADVALQADVAIRAAGEVPVGGVVSYYGEPANLPASWRLCDGSAISDGESPLNGKQTPDLRGMFVRGAEPESDLGDRGGQDYTPDHGHYVSASGSVWIGTKSINGWSGYQHPSQAHAFSPNIHSFTFLSDVAGDQQDTHGHTGTASVNGDAFSGGAHDNRPRFLSLHYIIRIK